MYCFISPSFHFVFCLPASMVIWFVCFSSCFFFIIYLLLEYLYRKARVVIKRNIMANRYWNKLIIAVYFDDWINVWHLKSFHILQFLGKTNYEGLYSEVAFNFFLHKKNHLLWISLLNAFPYIYTVEFFIAYLYNKLNFCAFHTIMRTNKIIPFWDM